MYTEYMITTYLFVPLVATVVQFAVSAVWYTPIFGQLWGKIHGFDTLSKKKQEEMMAGMAPIFVAQAVFTLITSLVLVYLYNFLPEARLLNLVGAVWLGFVVPAHASGVLFGGTKAEWIATKIAILSGGSLVSLLAGAFVVQLML